MASPAVSAPLSPLAAAERPEPRRPRRRRRADCPSPSTPTPARSAVTPCSPSTARLDASSARTAWEPPSTIASSVPPWVGTPPRVRRRLRVRVGRGARSAPPSAPSVVSLPTPSAAAGLVLTRSPERPSPPRRERPRPSESSRLPDRSEPPVRPRGPRPVSPRSSSASASRPARVRCDARAARPGALRGCRASSYRCVGGGVRLLRLRECRGRAPC